MWIATEHVTPIVGGLIELYKIAGDNRYLQSAKRAIEWLLRMISKEERVYTSYPPEVYGFKKYTLYYSVKHGCTSSKLG